jgi:hypothetical protein
MHSLMSCVATQRSNSRAHCTHLTHSGSPANAIARRTRMSALKLQGLAIRCATLLGEMEAGEAHGDAVKQEQMSPDRDRAPQKRRALLQRRASPGLPRASGLLDVPSTGGIGATTGRYWSESYSAACNNPPPSPFRCCTESTRAERRRRGAAVASQQAVHLGTEREGPGPCPRRRRRRRCRAGTDDGAWAER